jgi:hypothetical protein
MAKKKTDDADAVPTLDQQVQVVPLFPGFEATPEPEGMQTVTLIGGGAYDGTYRLPVAIPQELSAGAVTYDLSDRAAGVYVWRHK